MVAGGRCAGLNVSETADLRGFSYKTVSKDQSFIYVVLIVNYYDRLRNIKSIFNLQTQ